MRATWLRGEGGSKKCGLRCSLRCSKTAALSKTRHNPRHTSAILAHWGQATAAGRSVANARGEAVSPRKAAFCHSSDIGAPVENPGVARHWARAAKPLVIRRRARSHLELLAQNQEPLPLISGRLRPSLLSVPEELAPSPQDRAGSVMLEADVIFRAQQCGGRWARRTGRAVSNTSPRQQLRILDANRLAKERRGRRRRANAHARKDDGSWRGGAPAGRRGRASSVAPRRRGGRCMDMLTPPSRSSQRARPFWRLGRHWARRAAA